MNYRILGPVFVGACFVGLATHVYCAEPAKREVRVVAVRTADAPIAPTPPTPGAGGTWAAAAEEATGPVAFLGVQMSKVDAALGAQLGLPRGIGVVINSIVAEGPAEGVLEKYDVVVKIEDQLITSPEHLGVLVRTKTPGDTVILTYRRAGTEATATLKLGSRPPRTAGMPAGWGSALEGRLESLREGLSKALPREEIERVMESLRRADGAGRTTTIRREGRSERDVQTETETEGEAGERPVARIMSLGNVHLRFQDEAGTVDLRVVEGQRVAKITDAAGVVLHDGPLGTAEEQQALPEAVRARLRQVENLQGVQLSPERPLPPGEVHFVPRAEKIGRFGPMMPVAPVAVRAELLEL